jgi:hypothetical protein
MKKFILISLVVTNVFVCHSQTIDFPDISFENRLLAIVPKINTNGNVEINESESSLVTSLDV